MELREKRFKDWLNKRWPKNTQVTNVESYTKAGIPDTFVQIPGCIGFWIEFKVNQNSAFPLLRPEQRIWGIKNEKAGGKAIVLLLDENTEACYIFDHPILEIELVGKYLRVLDNPMCVVKKQFVAKYLETYSKQ